MVTHALVPALRRHKQVALYKLEAKSGLHREIQASQDYTVEACLKTGGLPPLILMCITVHLG